MKEPLASMGHMMKSMLVSAKTFIQHYIFGSEKVRLSKSVLAYVVVSEFRQH
jgi:hypothetical protein